MESILNDFLVIGVDSLAVKFDALQFAVVGKTVRCKGSQNNVIIFIHMEIHSDTIPVAVFENQGNTSSIATVLSSEGIP